MMEGARVRHEALGIGTVIEFSARRGAKVDFGYTWTWVDTRELEVVDEIRRQEEDVGGDHVGIELQKIRTAQGRREPAYSVLLELPTEVVNAKRAVMALKLGHMLEENVFDLSVGLDGIRKKLESHVAEAVQRNPQSILVEGAWGTGKTHLLTLLKVLASQCGLATASVILDGEGIAMWEPMDLMEAVLGSLRYPGDRMPLGIDEHLRNLRSQVSQFRSESRLGWRLARAIFEIPTSAFDESEVMEVIEDYLTMKLAASQAMAKLRQFGWRVVLPPIKAQRIEERADRLGELLTGWAEFCVLTGAKGLVVVFDELDVEYAMTASRPSLRARRARLLTELSTIEARKCPLLFAFGSAPASDDLEQENDAVRDVLYHVPWSTHITAPLPSLAQTIELGERLQGLYRDAYPDRMAKVDRHDLQRQIAAFAEKHLSELDPTPRDFVRGTLERLDLAPSNGP